MGVANAILLGIVQGLTEFLPVSSSGHLVLVEKLLGVKAPGVFFEVVLHAGTLLAVFVAFADDISRIVTRFLAAARRPGAGGIPAGRFAADPDTHLGVMIIVGSVPAALVGLAFSGFFESLFSSLNGIAATFALSAGLLFAAERAGRTGRRLPSMTAGDALAVGLFQAAAIAPGLSRSGATISMGIFRGIEREAAARFSFLLSIPVVLGATALKVGEAAGAGATAVPWGAALAGAGAAAVSGFLAIRWLLRVLRTSRLYGFVAYLLAAALLSALLAARGF